MYLELVESPQIPITVTALNDSPFLPNEVDTLKFLWRSGKAVKVQDLVGTLATLTIEGATIDFNAQLRLKHDVASVDPFFRPGERVSLLAQPPAEAKFLGFETARPANSAPVQNKHWARVLVDNRFNVKN
jgi:hypothetical protein